MAGNGSNGILAGAPAVVNVDHSLISGNSVAGLRSTGAIIRIGNSMVVGNTTGLLASAGGTIVSLGNNAVRGNGTDGAFDDTLPRL